MNKKAALNLGISTVVVLVIAMVLIGAGVSFIRGVFSDVPMPGDIVDVSDLANPPTRENPLRIDGSTIRAKPNEYTSFRVGVYNSYSESIEASINSTPTCIGGDLEGEDDQVQAEITSLQQTIQPSSGAAFIARFKPNDDMGEGDYICAIGMDIEEGVHDITPIQVEVRVRG